MVSSLGAEFSTARTSTSTGLRPVLSLTILNAVRIESVILLLAPPLDPGFAAQLLPAGIHWLTVDPRDS